MPTIKAWTYSWQCHDHNGREKKRNLG
jgi:hypothetical protein